ncbi:MAG: hypothetical protein KJ645_07275, partial [Planctomycetes bacterium]|nr:hypothetical protein [Planctomycetota bacterium]
LTVFNLRLGASLDPDEADLYRALCKKQEERFLCFPRTRGGWLDVNRFGEPEDPHHPRDSYAYPTEYSSAAACYLLLSRLYVPSVEDPPAAEAAASKLPSGIWHAPDLGLAMIRNRDWEAGCRTGSLPGMVDRRVLGPTLVHLSFREDVLVGAVPMHCAEDFECRSPQAGRVGRIASRFRHDLTHGLDSLNALYAGYVPVVVQGKRIHFPAAPIETRQEAAAGGGSIRTVHPFVCCVWRGFGVAFQNLMGLVLKNLMPGHQITWKPCFEQSALRLTRTIILDHGGLRLSDHLKGATGKQELLIGVRGFEGLRITAQGLDEKNRLICRGCDGLSRLRLFSAPCGGGEARYEISLNTDG